MVETTPRVVLLARPGKAADNLAEALRQAGADLVAVEDPSGMAAQALLDHRPQAVLVALEPGIEPAVEALDEVLASPDLTVIFDEADIAAQRAGWDAARWVRHLSAKLHRHDDVLPPGAEPDQSMLPTPGNVPRPESAYANRLDFDVIAREAQGRAESVPADELRGEWSPPTGLGSLDVTPGPADAGLVADAASTGAALTNEAALPVHDSTFSGDDLSIDSLEIESLAFDSGDGLFTVEDGAADAGDESSGGLELAPIASDALDAGVIDDISFDSSSFDSATFDHVNPDSSSFDDGELRDFERTLLDSSASTPAAEDEPAGFDLASLESLGFDPALLQPIAPEAAPRAPEPDPFAFDLSPIDQPPATPPAPEQVPQARSAPPVGMPDFSSLSLADTDADTPVQQAAPTAGTARRHDLGDLEKRIAGLSLVDIEPEEVPSAAAAEHPLEPLMPYDEVLVTPSAPAAADPMTGEGMPPLMADAPMSHSVPPPLPTTMPPLPTAPVAASASPSGISLRGVVLVEAGLGGPDPVRQLLAGLPAGFPLPLVVRLQLQGGRYDRLVAQMERAASMPVMLAHPDMTLSPGCIHFLPEGVGLRRNGDALAFDVAFGGADSLLDTLESMDDGALVFLSGSDPSLVDRAVSLAASSDALVAAQSPEDCYDGVACAQLRGRGVPTAAAPELAARLAQRWPH